MMAETFNAVYEKHLWGEGSGAGSMAEGLGPYKEFLGRIIRAYGVKHILDMGCGFFEPYAKWLDWFCVDYIGVDVSEQCYQSNSKFTDDHHSFIKEDWLRSNFPFSHADLVICKDVLQHWSESDILRGLKVLKRFPLMLITNSIVNGSNQANRPIKTGEFRPLNLLCAPYLLDPIEIGSYVVTTNRQDVKLMLLCRNNVQP